MRSTIHCWAASLLLLAAALPPAADACVGDCNTDARVTIDELVRAVDVALGGAAIATCDAVDNNRDGTVTINELVRAVTKAQVGCGGGPAGEVLFSPQDDQLDEVDLASGAATTTVASTHAHVNGQVCLLPGGDGRYVAGEDTGQPEVRPGWGIFAADGTFLQKVTLPAFANETANPDPLGCAVDAQGRLFGTAIGSQGGADGHLVVFFPPDYRTSCVLDAGLRTPGLMASDDAGNLYVPEAGPPGRVQRYSGPFPATAGECATVAPTRSAFIAYDDAVASLGVARGREGHFFVSNVVGLGGSAAGIREHDADGTFVREILPAGDWGNPAGVAFDSQGTLYYADLGLNAQNQDVPGAGTVRRVAFDGSGQPTEPELVRRGLSFPDGLAVLPSRADEWLTLGGSLRRTYFNPRERLLNASTAPQLINKWRYPTSAMISAQAAVTWVDLPGEGRTQIVIVPSWDRTVYALRTENGSRVWRYQMKPQPGTFYPFAGSPTIAWVDGQQRVFVPGGETLYCLDAASGAELWQFDAGTGCTDCTTRQERNEIESTPAVVDGLVLLGMDTNDGVPGKGAIFALRADDGRLAWWFDVVTQSTCRPFAADDIRKFDGFHDAAALGLPEGFLETRPGCNFDRTSNGCGNVWSSMAVDMRRRQLYTVSSNCDIDDDPSTPQPPVTPPLEEAIISLTLDGDLAWSWRPREVDLDDLDFGAVPNLFEAEIGGAVRDVVGVGGKDGTYYALDRGGVNQLTGRVEPYWATNVVPGGPIGGIIGSASVGEGIAVFSTGFGTSISRPQKPAVHALNLSDGSIRWQDSSVDTSYAPCMGVPGLALCGGTPRPNINVFDRRAGTLLKSVLSAPVPSGVAAGATVVGGQMFVGAGTGAFNEGPDANREANRDTPLSAFCLQGAPGCVANTCTDGNPCTYDYRDRAGTCVSEPGADGLDCKLDGADGHCSAGTCTAG
ncbi:MAG: PQQ-binding-like beta-propeller repeat protein [Candidatus Binatia bacterium]